MKGINVQIICKASNLENVCVIFTILCINLHLDFWVQEKTNMWHINMGTCQLLVLFCILLFVAQGVFPFVCTVTIIFKTIFITTIFLKVWFIALCNDNLVELCCKYTLQVASVYEGGEYSIKFCKTGPSTNFNAGSN